MASSAVLAPNLGLYFDRPSAALDRRALEDGFNFRIQEGRLNNFNLGWERFGDFQLNGPVVLIDNFFIRGQAERLIFGTTTDLYAYDGTTSSVSFITPRYEVGTAEVNEGEVTGAGGADWGDIKFGDFIHFGEAGQTDPEATWYRITGVVDSTTLEVEDEELTLANGPYTIRRTFTGNLLDVWDTEVFVRAAPENEDQWWATNSVDPIVRWNGEDDQVEIMDIGFTCATLAVYQNMMIFGNLVMDDGSARPTDIINSNPGEPANVLSGLSEQFRAHGGTDEIVNMAPIGDSLALYSSRTVTVANFVGGDLLFVFRNAISGLGAVSPKAITDFGDFHDFIGPDSFYTFDGVTVKETGTQVWRAILRQQDPTRLFMSYGHFLEEEGELIWVVPSTVDPGAGDQMSPPSRAFVGHYLEDVGEQFDTPYSARAFPFTASGYYERQEGLTWDQIEEQWNAINFRWNDQFFFAAFPLSLVGDIDGFIYIYGTQQNQPDGSALPSFVRFGRRALGDGRMRGLLSRVYPFVAQTNTQLQVFTEIMDHEAGPATTVQVDLFNTALVAERHFVSPFRRGRYYQVAFGTPGPNQPWQLEGFDIDIKVGGKR